LENGRRRWRRRGWRWGRWIGWALEIRGGGCWKKEEEFGEKFEDFNKGKEWWWEGCREKGIIKEKSCEIKSFFWGLLATIKRYDKKNKF
jgi:hypothetical protein